MVRSVQQIKYEVLAYIREFGGRYEEWVLGVADRPRERMTETHGVDLAADIWLYKQATTPRACATVLGFFERLGVQIAGPAPDDPDWDCVYLFRLAPHTRLGAPGEASPNA